MLIDYKLGTTSVILRVKLRNSSVTTGAGLTGLTRVLSFLGLGLSLAGLAWLNRWAGQAARRDEG